MARIGIKAFLRDHPEKNEAYLIDMPCIYRYSRPAGVTGKVYFVAESDWVCVVWDDKDEVVYLHKDSVELVV